MPAQPPALSWAALSEITFGKLAQGELSKNTVSAENFIEPYPRGVKYLRTSKAPSPDKIVECVGLPAYQAAVHAAEHVNGLKVNWPTLLHQAALNHALGLNFERIAVKLKAGETVDFGPVQKALRQHDDGLPQLTQMSTIKASGQDYEVTGFEPLDHWVGGLPKSTLTLVIGPPGTGKTYFFLKLAECYARQRKKVILFSLEMTMQQITRRAMKSMGMARSLADYIWVCDDILSPGDLSSIAGRTEGAELIGVDFAELLMVGERSEAAMAEAYWTLFVCAKNLGLPLVILGQQNRASLSEMVPMMGASRNTGMGDILAALELGLYNRSKILRKADLGDAPKLPLAPGNGAIVVIKARYGTKEKQVGAIEVPFDNEKGWGDKSVRWHAIA